MSTTTGGQVRPVSGKQMAQLVYICDMLLDRGTQPTLREMADHSGVSLHAVHQRMEALARNGYIQLAGAKSRSIRILAWPDGKPFTGLDRREG